MREGKEKVTIKEASKTHWDASTVESFKCLRCGHMFPTEGRDTAKCPVCGRIDKRGEDEIVFVSNEGF